MTRASTVELLAPAGDRDSLKAALLAGADAVYVGGTRFSARANAKNFDRKDLAWARRVTTRLGRRLYVAFNTLLFDEEWAQAEDDLAFLEDLGPDAIIVQDLGLLATLRDRGSPLPRHLSTQGAWDGAGGTSLLQDLGVQRVILPRESSLRDIEHLVDHAPFEIEVFVHGAHCYGVSGRCHWSVHLGPRSGNRGTCAQPCRRNYTSSEVGAIAAFSPKDLRTVGRIEQLSRLGVAAFKIEGRLKNARTIRHVVASYRAVMDGNATPDQVSNELDLAFSRQWCEGFLDGPPESWRTDRSVGHLGLRMGTVVEAVDGAGRTLVEADRPIRAGMGLSWSEPDGRRDGRRGDKVVWASEERGRVAVRFRKQAPTKAGTVLYATASSDDRDPCEGWENEWDGDDVRLWLEGRAGEPLRCRFELAGRTGMLASNQCLELARGKGVDEVVREKFQTLDEHKVVLDTSGLGSNLFVPPSDLKGLRRRLIEWLQTPESQEPPSCSGGLTVVDVAEGVGRFDYALRVFQQGWVTELTHRFGPPLGWVVPLACAPREGMNGYWIPPCHGPDSIRWVEERLEALADSELHCGSWEAFDLARRFPRHRFTVDTTFNVTNARAARVVRDAGVGYDTGIDSPRPLRFATQVLRVNPLVTVSRFPLSEGTPVRWCSDRGDVLHLHRLGESVGTFLERWPEIPEHFTSPMRVDVFVPPGTDPDTFFERLRTWLAACDARARLATPPPKEMGRRGS